MYNLDSNGTIELMGHLFRTSDGFATAGLNGFVDPFARKVSKLKYCNFVDVKFNIQFHNSSIRYNRLAYTTSVLELPSYAEGYLLVGGDTFEIQSGEVDRFDPKM